MGMLVVTLSFALLMLATPLELHAQARGARQADSMASMASTASPPATIAAIALSIRSRAIQDSRCYLMNGGAVESFFISEDSPVGSIIGTLSVNGDPSEGGDISLRVQERGAAVGVAAGSKNVTLLRALDREERRGPSNVYVNVRCDRRLTADPSFIIPVSVRVWDVNDNAPVWEGAPYRARLSELTAVGARVLTARATDADQPGPHATVRYSVLPGPHSEHFAFANELEGTVVVAAALDYERLHNVTVRLRAADHGSPPRHADTQLVVEVLDADDQNPKFTHEHYSAQLPPNAQVGTVLSTSPGPIAAADQDLGINAPLQYSSAGDDRQLVLVDKDSGALAATERLLAMRQPVTVVIKAVQVDNPDRYALATVTVSPGGGEGGEGGGGGATDEGAPQTTQVRFARRQFAAAVSEAAPPGSVLLTLHTEPAHPTRPLQFFVSERSFLEHFAISAAGDVLLRRALDYETQPYYHYQVMVTDGLANDTASINITVTNVNEWEPRFRYPQYEFSVEPPAESAGIDGESDAELLPVGKLDVYDGDKADTITLSLSGPDAGALYVNASGGVWARRAALAALAAPVLRARATARDDGAPPRETSVPVIVHVSESLMQKKDKSAGGVPVLAMFGSALAVLALLLCVLLLYIHRSRRSKSSPSAVSKPYLSHEKSASPPSPPAPAAAAPPAAVLAPAGSLQSVSAGASTILANSSSSLDLRDSLPGNGHPLNGNGASGRQSCRVSRGKVAPAGVAGAGVGASGAGGAAPTLMSDHVGGAGGAGGRSGVAWPSATIPARVKKLSWDDAADLRKDSAEEVHDATNPSIQEHMNLTVYF